MTYASVRNELRATLEDLRAADLYQTEHRLTSPQSPRISVARQEFLNFCANNYLGLANHPAVIAAAQRALEEHGFGMASVRFICGTQTLHTELEARLSALLGTEATILYSSCFDANGGVFATLLDQPDAVFSDALNHASIIDGIRLSKARRHRYRTLAELETQLASTAARRRLIVTDGVFSMDGSIAPLREICDLADQHDALVMVDDSHATGILGETGAGTPELLGVRDRVDIVTGTLGKALGGASGGFVSAHAEIVDLLRQRSRPYLFSNALPPAIVAGTLTALDLADPTRRATLHRNTAAFRSRMSQAGFHLLPGEHPIVPVMLGDAAEAVRMAERMLRLGVYVTAFSYPVVPLGEARIRVQISSEHSFDDLDRCVAAFVAARG